MRRETYARPQVTTVNVQDVLDELGPAQATLYVPGLPDDGGGKGGNDSSDDD